MADDKTNDNSQEENNEITVSCSQKDNVWSVKEGYVVDTGLSFVEAGFLSIVETLSYKTGFAYPSNKFLCKILGVSDRQIQRFILDLVEQKLLYVHYYTTRGGRKRELVTKANPWKYAAYLEQHKRFDQLKKLKDEFLIHIQIPTNKPDPPTDPKPDPDKQKITSNKDKDLAPDKNSNRESAPDTQSHVAPDTQSHAYNTTYYPNRTSDVTCKEADAPVAASLLDLRKELGKSFSPKDIEIGMQWYKLQSDSKKATMKKPIAYITKALQGGYAQEGVAEKDDELKQELQEKKEIKQQQEMETQEMNNNVKLAHQLIFKFAESDGWRHKIDSKCFVVFNDSIEPTKDEETGLKVCIMPNGTKRFGTPAVRVDFDMSQQEFRSTLQKFFIESKWKEEPKNRKIS